MTESLCDDNKFYDYICHVILFSLYFNKHIKYTKLQELRNLRRRISTIIGWRPQTPYPSTPDGSLPIERVLDSVANKNEIDLSS
jgi:hypothetical protein